MASVCDPLSEVTDQQMLYLQVGATDSADPSPDPRPAPDPTRALSLIDCTFCL